MKIKVYSVNIGECDKARTDGVFAYTENNLFYDAKRQANMYTALSHIYAEGADVSIYVAGNLMLKAKPEVIVKELLGDADIAIYKHHKRDCVYLEARILVNSNKDTAEVVEEHMQKYRDEGYPENGGLVETGMIIRRHNKRVEAFNNAWFAEMCRYSRRQQLSFNYVADKYPRLKVNMIDGNVRVNDYLIKTKHNQSYLRKKRIEGCEQKLIKADEPEKFKTIIVIRSRYQEITPLRLELMQKYCINSLKQQTDKDFEIHILVQSATADKIKSLNWGRLKVFFKEETPSIGWERYSADLRKEYMRGPNIQIRMDNDDWVAPNFIERIRQAIGRHKNILVNFHPTKFLHHNRKSYYSQKHYSRDRVSMFFAIYQEKPEHWILDRQHGRMGSLFAKRIYVKQLGLCNIVIHSENVLNAE